MTGHSHFAGGTGDEAPRGVHLEAHNVLQLLRGIPGLLSLDVFVDGGFPLKAIDVLTELCSSERQSWPEVTLRFRHADGPKPAMQDLDNLVSGGQGGRRELRGVP